MRYFFVIFVFSALFVSCLNVHADDDEDSNPLLIKLYIKKYDKNKDGKIARDKVDEKGLRIFAYVDRDCDEFVSQNELDVYAKEIKGDIQFYDKEKALKPVENAKMHKYINIPYAQVDGKNSKYTSLDIYTPAKAEKLPVFVFVHGGAWTIGDKSACYYKPEYFTKENWVYVTVNYRLVPKVKFPENIQDVANALAWVHDHIKDYGGNPDKIVIMGHSAGAHLVSLVATDESRLRKAKKDLKIIKAVISLDTNGYDIPPLTAEKGAMKNLYEKAFGKDKEVQKVASPMTHVKKEKNIPPFVLVHVDNNKKKQESTEAFAKALKNAEIKVKTISAPDKTHGTINQQFGKKDDKDTQKIMKSVAEYLDIKKTNTNR